MQALGGPKTRCHCEDHFASVTGFELFAASCYGGAFIMTLPAQRKIYANVRAKENLRIAHTANKSERERLHVRGRQGEREKE